MPHQKLIASILAGTGPHVSHASVSLVYNPDLLPQDFPTAFLRRLRTILADVPNEPVVLLSGGLDSSLLLAILTDLGKQPLALTMASRFKSQNETHVARQFCQSLKVPLIEHSISGVDPFRSGGVHFRNRDIGLGLYPGLEYETDTLVHASRYSSTIVSGVWADQLFSPSDGDFLDIAVTSNSPSLWDTVISKRGLRFAASHFASKSGRWRSLRVKPTWGGIDGWLHEPPKGQVVHPFLGFHAQLVEKSIAAMEREAGSSLLTPYRDVELAQRVESFEPVERVAKAPNKLALREIASQILPREVAYRPKTAHFTEIFQDALKRMPKEEILRRLIPLEPYFNVSAEFLAEEAMSVREGRALVRLTYALILGDVLSYDA